jgi:hypothetical protein
MVASISQVPAYLLQVPDSITDILVADIEAATMYRFEHKGDQILEKDQRYMSIGQNGPGKEKAWDRFNERTGYGIWLHGVDHRNPERPPRDTDGCLSLPNEELLKLVGSLEPLVTPVIVARTMVWALPAEVDELRLEFQLALDMWRDSLASGDILTYLSLYADDFRYRDMDRGQWSSYRLNVFEARQLEGVTLDDVMLVADPEVADLYLSRFTQVLATSEGPVTTTKRLYWRRADDNQWQIVAEDSG